MSKLTIIYYHDIVEDGLGIGYQKVEVSNFEKQMKFLAEERYHTLLFEELNGSIPEKSVLVTFDDGFRSIYEKAVPIMEKYNIKGNVFLPTKYVDENHSHFMTWEMLKELCNKRMFSVAAHTHTHVDIRTLDDEKMKSEIEANNGEILQKLGIKTKSFCMPYGKYDPASIERIRKCGDYDFVYASFYGQIVSKKMRNSVIPRIGISNDDSIKVFEKKIKGKKNWKGPLQRIRLKVENLKGERITQYDIE